MAHVINKLMEIGQSLIIEDPFSNIMNNRGKENEEKDVQLLVERCGDCLLSLCFLWRYRYLI